MQNSSNINQSAFSDNVKNYLYYFEFFSGEYEDSFYQQIQAENERMAIIQVISNFRNEIEEDTKQLLTQELGEDWTVDRFWQDMDLSFQPNDDYVGYNLYWIKEIDYDLNRL